MTSYPSHPYIYFDPEAHPELKNLPDHPNFDPEESFLETSYFDLVKNHVKIYYYVKKFLKMSFDPE